MTIDHDNYPLLELLQANGQTGSDTSDFELEPSQIHLDQDPEDERLPLDKSFVIPFLLAAICTGAMIGYFWKRR
jgi:hypothetical protein